MRHISSTISSKTTNLKFLCFLFLLGISIQLDQCTDPKATFYDGYLDTFIYYASFNRDQGSYFRFKNPFEGTANLTQGSVIFWAKLPKLSSDGTYQKGRMFECTDSLLVRLENNTIKVNITQNVTNSAGVFQKTLSVTQLSITLNSTDQLLEWNNYAFSFSGKKLRVHINGIQVGEKSLTYSAMSTFNTLCTIGNSKDLKDPFNGYMRHLVFSKEGFSSNQDITNKIRSVILPNDTNVLAYFKFQKDFNYQEAYFYNSSRTYTYANLSIQYSSEPESVCYCTSSYPAFLKVTKDYKLKPLDLTPTNVNFDQNGITLQFWMYPLKLDSDNDTVIFSISNYTDIVLANKGTNLRVDLYSKPNIINTKLVLSKYRFRFQFWTLYTIQISSTQVILYVDGTLVETVTHNTTLPTSNNSTFITGLGDSLSSLLYRIELYQNTQSNLNPLQLSSIYLNPKNSNSQPEESLHNIFKFTVTEDQLNYQDSLTTSFTSALRPGSFLSSEYNLQLQGDISSYVEFAQNNEFCQDQSSDSVSTLWNGLTCKGLRLAPQFKHNSDNSKSTKVYGSFKTAISNTTTIDLWFKLQDSQQEQAVLFSSYEMINGSSVMNPIFEIVLVSLNELPIISCNPLSSVSSEASIFDPTSFVKDKWMHLTCISSYTSPTKRSMGVLIYNQETQDENYQLTLGTSITATSNTQWSYIGTTQESTNAFNGLIREVRVFKQAFTIEQMELTRFIKSPKYWIDNIIVNQFSLSEGYQSLYFDSSIGSDIVSTPRNQYQAYIGNTDSFQWVEDKELVVCPVNTYYNGQCCSSASNISVSISQTETSSLFYVNATLGNPYLDVITKFTWTLSSVSYVSKSYAATITKSKTAVNSSVVSQTNNQNLSIPISDMLHSTAYNLTLHVQSPVLTANLSQYQLIFLECPIGKIVNSTTPVITQWGYETKVQIQSGVWIHCYEGNKTVKSVAWSHNNTKGLLPYTLTSNSYNITFNKESNITNDTTIQANYTVTFGNSKVMTDTRLVTFLKNGVNLVVDDFYYLPYKYNTIINASQSQLLVNTVNSSEVTFGISCPTSLITNYTQDCVINQNTGVFTLPWSKVTNAALYTNYTFNVTYGKSKSVLSQTKPVQVQWYSSNSGSQSCPAVVVTDQILKVSKNDLKTFIYTPNFIFDCNNQDAPTIKYKKQLIQYSLNQERLTQIQTDSNATLSFSSFSDIFSVQHGGFQFTIINDTVVNSIQPGDIIPITIFASVQNPETYEVINQTTTFEIQVQQSDIEIISSISNTIVPFEEDLVINASLSYDPDVQTSTTSYNTSGLAYQYMCNRVLCDLNSTQMSKGVLRVNLTDRMRLNYSYDRPYEFSVLVYNPLFPRKLAKSATYSVRFSSPSNGTHSCPKPYLYKSVTTTRNTSYYFNTANISTNTTETLKIGYENCNSLSYQFMMIVLDLPDPGISSNKVPQEKFYTNTNNNFTLIGSGLLNRIDINQTVTVTVSYVFNYTSSGTRKVGYSVSTLNITRVHSNLVAILNPNNTSNSGNIQVGLEEWVSLSSLQSYDPDNNYLRPHSQNINLTYSCSSSLSTYCADFQNQQTIMITKAMRKLVSLTKVGTTFWISLTLKADGRTSTVSNVTLVLTSQDYTKCFSIYAPQTQIRVSNADSMIMPSILKPKYLQVCEDAYITSDVQWSSTYFSLGNFWSAYSDRSYAVSISPEMLRNFPREVSIPLTVKVPYQFVDNNTTTQYSQNLTYYITVAKGQLKAQLNIPKYIFLQQQEDENTQYISAGLINVPNAAYNDNLQCVFTCYFGTYTVQNCTGGNEYNSCQLDILKASLPYAADLSTTQSYVEVQVNSMNQTFSTKQTMVFIQDNTTSPLCTINVLDNTLWEVDYATILALNCSNYDLSQLKYTWTFEGLSSTNFANDYDKQVLKVKPYSFLELEGTTPTIQVMATLKSDSTISSITSILMNFTYDSSVKVGNLQLSPKGGELLRTMMNITINNFSDTAGEMLFYQMKYNTDEILVSKTTKNSFLTILPDISELIIEVFNQNGYLAQRKAKLSNTLPQRQQSPSEFESFYQSTISYIPDSEDLISQNLDFSDIELGFNNLLQLSVAVNKEVNDDQTKSIYYDDILSRTSILLNGAIKEVKIAEIQYNCMYKGLQIMLQVYNQSTALTIYDMLQNQVSDDLYIQGTNQSINALLYQEQLVTKLLQDLELTEEQEQDLSNDSKNALYVFKSNMLSGEQITISSENIVLKKYTLSDLNDELTVSNDDIQFDVSKAIFNSLSGDAFIQLKLKDTSTFVQSNQPDLTITSQIIDIEIQDTNSNVIEMSDASAQITFSNVDVDFYNNLKCGYYNIQNSTWLLEKNGGLTTTLDKSNNQVKCTTTHLSTFSVFNQTVNSDQPNIDNPGEQKPGSKDDQNPGKIAVSIIQIILIVLSIIMFIIRAISENTERKIIVEQFNFEKFEEGVLSRDILFNFSKPLSICKGKQLNLVNRILICLNYLLWVSLFILINQAIHTEERTVGDAVYLIIAIVLVFIFTAPTIKHWLIYKHFKFIPVKKFSNIFKTESPRQQHQSVPSQVSLVRNNELNKANDKSNEKPSQYLTPSAGGKSSDSKQNLNQNSTVHNQADNFSIVHDEFKKDSFHQKQKFQINQNLMEDREIGGMKYNNYYGQAQPSQVNGIESEMEINSSEFGDRGTYVDVPRDQIFDDDVDFSSGQTAGQAQRMKQEALTTKNLQQLSKNIQIHSMSKNLDKSDEDENHNDRSDSKFSPKNDEFEFEGGSDEENGAPSDLRSGTSPIMRDPHTQYGVNDIQDSVPERDLLYSKKDQNKMNEFEAAIQVKQSMITIIQGILLVIAAGLNGYLFWQVKIQESLQIKTYIGCLIISLLFLLVIFDFIISLFIAVQVKKKGLKNMNACGAGIALGFFGLDRLKTLQ